MEALLHLAGESIRAHLGHARVVVGARIPGLFDALARRGYGRARFAGVDCHTHSGCARIHAVLPRHLCQAQSVAWCANQHSCSDLFYSAQALQRIHAATRNRQRA